MCRPIGRQTCGRRRDVAARSLDDSGLGTLAGRSGSARRRWARHSPEDDRSTAVDTEDLPPTNASLHQQSISYQRVTTSTQPGVKSAAVSRRRIRPAHQGWDPAYPVLGAEMSQWGPEGVQEQGPCRRSGHEEAGNLLQIDAGAAAANWRISTCSVVNLARSQIYNTERPPYLFAAHSPWCSVSREFVSDSWSSFINNSSEFSTGGGEAPLKYAAAGRWWRQMILICLIVSSFSSLIQEVIVSNLLSHTVRVISVNISFVIALLVCGIRYRQTLYWLNLYIVSSVNFLRWIYNYCYLFVCQCR